MFVLLKVSQLILLSEAAQREGVPLPDLVPSAQQIRQAIESLVLAGQKLVTETPDDVCTIMYIAISRKVVGKSARNNPKRYCGRFWVHRSSKKFERMAREAMNVCSRVLKESNKSRSKATVSGTVNWSYPILPFGIVACTFFPTTFLEVAVYVQQLQQTTTTTTLSNSTEIH